MTIIFRSLAAFGLSLALLLAVPAARADVVLAESAPVGPQAGPWSNMTQGHNFLVQFKLTQATAISAFDLYTVNYAARLGMAVAIKIRQDVAGVPAARALHRIDDVVDSKVAFDAENDISTINFAPLTLEAGTYWIGASGINEELSWLSFEGTQGTSPADQAWLFNEEYLQPPIFGSLAWRLHGTVLNDVPEPASGALTALALLGLSLARRRSR